MHFRTKVLSQEKHSYQLYPIRSRKKVLYSVYLENTYFYFDKKKEFS